MINKKLLSFLTYITLISYMQDNCMEMRRKKNFTRLQGTHQQVFAMFNESSDYPIPITGEQINSYLTTEDKNKIAEEYINSLNLEQKEELLSSHIEKVNNQKIAIAKQYYINDYHNTWFEQLKKTATDINKDAEQEKLIALTIEAYHHLCLDKTINIPAEKFWTALTVKVRMAEKQDGAVDSNNRHIQVKTPLTEIFTIIKDKTEQIIKNDQDTAKKFRKSAQKQNRYNETIGSQATWIDFIELGSILPSRTGIEITQDMFADFLATHLIYYIPGNNRDKKEILNINNKTAQYLQKVDKLIPTKKKLTSHEKAKITLEQLTKLKEKQNDKH